MINVENVYGSTHNDTITGNANINDLEGGGGNDTLNGGDGNDYLEADVGDDFLNGGDGIDRVYFNVAAVTQGIQINLLTQFVANDGYGGTETMTSIEQFAGYFTFANTTFADTFIGDNNNNTIAGGDADTLVDATGNTLANTIIGNSGSNVIAGGLGNDILTGGSGVDFFVFNTTASAANRDTITDFNVAADTIRLENAIFTALGAAGALSSGAFFQGAAAHDANDRIIYNPLNGALIYDSNGSAAGGAIQIATLDTGLVLTSGDFGVI